MKAIIILTILCIFVVGCSVVKDSPPVSKISGTQDLLLNAEDIAQFGISSDLNDTDRQFFEISNGTDCKTDNNYGNIVDSSQGQYSICIYNIAGLNNTQLIIEFTKFQNFEELNGSYQYSSSHLYSAQGLISENDFGDQSRFRVSDIHDYGGEFNDPNIFYYHLWICKDKYLIHITSKGSKDVKEPIKQIAKQILKKFE